VRHDGFNKTRLAIQRILQKPRQNEPFSIWQRFSGSTIIPEDRESWLFFNHSRGKLLREEVPAMTNEDNRKRMIWIGIGLLAGVAFSTVLPTTPTYAVATHGADNFALATGLLDNNIEGVFFLDGLTGDLKGAAINLSNGQFATFYQSNVLKDLMVDGAKQPKFLMVTGAAALRHGPSQVQPGLSVVYVIEVNSGILAAYGVPWNGGRPLVATQQFNPFILLNKTAFRNVAVRPQ
jgi:hypothetical protein